MNEITTCNEKNSEKKLSQINTGESGENTTITDSIGVNILCTQLHFKNNKKKYG